MFFPKFFYGSRDLSGLETLHFRGFTMKPGHITLTQTTIVRTPLINPSQNSLPDNKQISQETYFFPPSGIWTHNLSKREATGLLIRPRFQRDRLFSKVQRKAENRGLQNTNTETYIIGYSSSQNMWHARVWRAYRRAEWAQHTGHSCKMFTVSFHYYCGKLGKFEGGLHSVKLGRNQEKFKRLNERSRREQV